MSTKLGTLTLDLIAKISNFTGPIRDAERQTESSFTNMRKHVNNYSAIAIAGAAAVGAGIFAMASEYANAANELETFAFISKTTTQEFQGYAVGAQTMGIEMETLAAQFKDFNEKLGEFVTLGSGGAVDFFEQIAIKTEGSAEGARKLALEMQNLSGPKALQLYVDKLEEAGVTQQQMSFYLESMASDTTNLIPLLRDGGKGFEYWADAAERAGVIMDESAIAKAAELRVQMDLLNLQVEGAKNQFIQGLMPALVSVGDGMSSASHETNLMSEAGETLGEVFKGVAATGMGVYAVVKMLSNAIAGLSLDAITAKKNVDLAAQGGSWADKLPGVKLGKSLIYGATISRAPDSGVSMAAQDNAKVVDDVANSINRIYSDTVNQSAAAMAKIQSSQAGVTKGSDEWIKKQNEAAKAASGVNKELQERERLLEQQERDRKSISYAYADQEKQIQLDLNDEIKTIREANFPDPDKYLEAANRKAYLEKQIYLSQLQYEINEFNLNEEQKLKYKTEINQLMIQADLRLTEENREIKLKALDEQYALELQKAKFHAQNMQQVMQESISGLAGDADNIFAQATMSPQDYDRWSLENDRSNAKSGLKNQRVGVEQDIMTSDLYSTDDERYEALLEAHKEYRDGLAAIDVKYAEDSKALAEQQELDQLNLWSGVLGQAQNTFAQLTQSAKNSAGEQSSVYKTMFAMQQAFSVASSLTAAWTAYAQAFADPSAMTLPQKIAGGATVLAALMPAVTTISSIGIDGMAHDGIDNIPKEGTWLLDKGERVVDSRTNADLKNMIAEGGASKAPNVNVYTLPGETADVSWNDGRLDVRIRKISRETIAGDANDPNSSFSKSMKRNFTVSTKR